MLIKKQNGELEQFDPMKLEASLLRAGASKKLTEEIVEDIVGWLKKGATTRQIYRRAFSLLKNNQRSLAAKYSLKHAIADLGPSGFPFERLIARMFEEEGYATRIGVTVQGRCVPHEIDVLSHKDNELILVEAKFHNDESLKSDSKDVLYIKARFEDLSDTEIEFSSDATMKMTNGMLITNTKFSSGAIQFAECAPLTILGWSYPDGDGLRERIERAGVHPLTALTSLSHSQKRLLIKNELLLCRDIKENPDALKEVGVGKEEGEEVLQEINEIIGDV